MQTARRFSSYTNTLSQESASYNNQRSESILLLKPQLSVTQGCRRWAWPVILTGWPAGAWTKWA